MNTSITKLNLSVISFCYPLQTHFPEKWKRALQWMKWALPWKETGRWSIWNSTVFAQTTSQSTKKTSRSMGWGWCAEDGRSSRQQQFGIVQVLCIIFYHQPPWCNYSHAKYFFPSFQRNFLSDTFASVLFEGTSANKNLKKLLLSVCISLLSERNCKRN